MTINEIKLQITELAKKHAATGDDLDGMKDSEMIECDAEDLINEYCESMGYQVDGFPIDKRKTMDEDEQSDYFTYEQFRLYRALLTATHEDVAELSWHYEISFWPDFTTNKEEYIAKTKEELSGGLYDGIEL